MSQKSIKFYLSRKKEEKEKEEKEEEEETIPNTIAIPTVKLSGLDMHMHENTDTHKHTHTGWKQTDRQTDNSMKNGQTICTVQ